ncbi:MAG: GGDEF domain-containing protein [Candidatus Thiodiazotropha sp.]|nr:GGDEF domain-containing protein [Candidatus Thiodiazotropha sp.]MCM8921236.1 GGDEF domain-containing protein [Candidatus Thiodiazotropha sp.]
MQSQNTTIHYDQTVDIIRTILPRMSEYRIPITPRNYAVWFEYFAKTNQALIKEMEALLTRDTPITEHEIGDLYTRYLNQRGEQISAAKSALSQMIATLLNEITQADGNYGDLSSTLSLISDELTCEGSAEDIGALIDRALNTTAIALNQGAKLKEQLGALRNEIVDLRDEIERSQEQARIDPLTGLQNRLAFQEELGRLSQTTSTDAHPLCLMMMDIDFFKKVNDTHGHVAGDLVLQNVAKAIAQNLKGKDVVARYGGEEFVVMLCDTPRSGCNTVAESIRAGIESCQIRLPDDNNTKHLLSVTMSLGGSWYREGESFERFVDRADRALYTSKKRGRNQVTWEGRESDGMLGQETTFPHSDS